MITALHTTEEAFGMLSKTSKTSKNTRSYESSCDSSSSRSNIGVEQRLHSTFEKSMVERTMEYLEDRTEAFDDYHYPCMKAELSNL